MQDPVFKTYQPTHYTGLEGDYWQEWPEDIFLRWADFSRLAGKGEQFVYLHGLPVHSLRMANGEEWDCKGGWR